MKKIGILLCILLTSAVSAQHTISGEFTPKNDFKWLIAYRLTPNSQVYVADTAIIKGEFTLEIPQDTPVGTYRMVYAVPQEEFYFDVVYNGNEDIKLSFNQNSGVSFVESKENKLYETYQQEFAATEKNLIQFYQSGSTNKSDFKVCTKALHQVQETFEKKSEGLLVHQFIKANKPFIPTKQLNGLEYINQKKATYFNAINLKNPVLQGSSFIFNKVVNYVFTAVPDQLTTKEAQNTFKENIDVVATKLNDVAGEQKFHVFHQLFNYALANKHYALGGYIFDTYLKNNAVTEENKTSLVAIEISNRLRIGAVAPNIEWEKNDEQFTLYSLSDAKYYVLVFWSSTCSHCLKELPALHKEISKNKDVHVVAVGLEDNKENWEIETSKLNSFSHAIALGKWDSTYADTYNITQTPTYFVLNADKEIIAKPNTDKDVIDFLNEAK